MENFDRRKHWENIYRSKQTDEVILYEPTPGKGLAGMAPPHGNGNDGAAFYTKQKNVVERKIANVKRL